MSTPSFPLIEPVSRDLTSPTSTEKSSLLNFLDRQHDEYRLKYQAWIDLRLLYEGGVLIKKYAERFLRRRAKESSDLYFARLERFTYQNLLGTALGWYLTAMFKDDPQINFNSEDLKKVSETKLEPYEKFLKDCDRTGSNFISFMKQSFVEILCSGCCYVLVDLPNGDDSVHPTTLLEQKESGLLDPYLVLYSPLNVTNWQTDALGNLEWALVKVERTDQRFEEVPEKVYNWYYFDRTNFAVYEARMKIEEATTADVNKQNIDVKKVRDGRHCLAHQNRVPLRKLSFQDGLWLANRSYLLFLDHLNQDNTLGWALFMSNLAMPVVIGDVDASGMTDSEASYLQFPSGTTYTWTEPEGKSFQHSAVRLESLREEAFRSVYLQQQGRSMSATPAMQSGESKRLDWIPGMDVLSGMGTDLRDGFQKVLMDVRDARQDSSVDPDIRGFDFEQDMSTDEVFAVSSVLGLKIPSKTFEKYVMKKTARTWMKGANQDVLSKMEEEVEKGPTLEEQMIDEEKRRVEMAAAGIRNAAAKSSGPPKPPGQGGGGRPAASN